MAEKSNGTLVLTSLEELDVFARGLWPWILNGTDVCVKCVSEEMDQWG